jgi:hypothetical protein
MRLLLECSGCGKTSEVSRLERVDGRLVATCGACGRQTFVPDGQEDRPQPTREADVPAAAPPAEDACPKCGRPRDPEGESCPRCGVVFALWVAPEAPFTAHPELMARWAELAGVPPEDPGHDRFLEACFRAGALSDAARAYKALATGGRPEPAARIRQIQLLSQMQFIPASPERRRSFRWVPWALVILVLLAALYLWTITPDDLMR